MTDDHPDKELAAKAADWDRMSHLYRDTRRRLRSSRVRASSPRSSAMVRPCLPIVLLAAHLVDQLGAHPLQAAQLAAFDLGVVAQGEQIERLREKLATKESDPAVP